MNVLVICCNMEFSEKVTEVDRWLGIYSVGCDFCEEGSRKNIYGYRGSRIHPIKCIFTNYIGLSAMSVHLSNALEQKYLRRLLAYRKPCMFNQKTRESRYKTKSCKTMLVILRCRSVVGETRQLKVTAIMKAY